MKLEHFSASRWETFCQCPLKYHGQYELGKEGEKHPLTNMGSGIHLMFEHATNAIIGKTQGSTDPMDYETLAVAEFGVLPEHVLLGRTLVKNALFWGYFRDTKHIAGAEIKIELVLQDGTEVHGVIDRLDIDAPRADIKDLKTQKNPFDDDKLKNNWQARIYNLGSRKLFPSITGMASVSFWVLRHRVQRVYLTAKDAEQAEQDIMRAANEIRSCTEPEPKPSALCPWCPLYKECDAHLRRPSVTKAFKKARRG